MIKAETIKTVLISQRKTFLNVSGAIKRQVLEDVNLKEAINIREVVIITGVRRAGKSYLMRLIWQKLAQEQKLSEDNFLYFNFEDERLLRFRSVDFELLLESYFDLFTPKKNKKIYLFFDEIQNIAGWEKFLNRLREDARYKIFVTGSNATLLSKEIGTALTGRNYPITLFPLSFCEFFEFKLERKATEKDFYDLEKKVALKKLFRHYLENGGFPEVVIQNFRPLLQEYLKNIIYRDIVLRYKIKNETNLREIVDFIVSNIGTILSLEKISRMIKMKNLMTVKNYLGHLENSFLFFLVPKFSHSLKKQIYNPDKIYVVDCGIYNEIAFRSSANAGRLLENAVYLELKRRKREIYYFKEKNECDFILKEKNKPCEAIQVTLALEPQNREREINGLLEAMRQYKLKNGVILTLEESAEIETEGKKILVKPIWRWMLEE